MWRATEPSTGPALWPVIGVIGVTVCSIGGGPLRWNLAPGR